MLHGDLVVVVADHDQGRTGVAGQVGDGERRLLRMHPVQLGGQGGEGVGAVGGDRAVVLDEEGGGLLVQVDGARRPAVVVEDPGGEHQPADQVGTGQRDQQGHRHPVAVADQVGRPADDLFQEGDRVLGHQLVGERAGDVGGAAVAAPVGPQDPEVFDQAGEVALEGAPVGAPRVQQHQRRPVAILLVVGAHLAELHVAAHCLSPLIGWSSIGRAGPVAGLPSRSDRPSPHINTHRTTHRGSPPWASSCWARRVSRPLDHPSDHPDDPTGPVWIRLDRQRIQCEQARSV